MAQDDELYVRIPIPQDTKRARGPFANANGLRPVKFRINDVDRANIKRAAVLCGVKEVPFYRWCALYVARAILERETGERVSIDP